MEDFDHSGGNQTRNENEERKQTIMKTYLKIVSAGLILAAGVTVLPLNASATPIVDLDTAADFAVLAGSGVTSTGATTLTGDLGLWPGTAVTETPAMTVNGVRRGSCKTP